MTADSPHTPSHDPHASTSVDDSELSALLEHWLPQQRWYGALEAGDVRLESRRPVASDVDGADVEHLVVSVPDPLGGEPRRYQLWVGWREFVPERLAHSVIGQVAHRTAYDALHDHAVSSLLLEAIGDSRSFGDLEAHAEPDAVIDVGAPGLVIGAEQSNTSVVYGDSAILKVFRLLHPGPNPDVEVHRALHAAGSTHIADPLGEIFGPVGGRSTTLALLTRFFANSADGWAMATASVRDLMGEGDLHADEVGGDFAAEAQRLGKAVAAVHTDLANAFGTHTVDGSGLAAAVADMIEQAELAAAQVPALAEHLDVIRAAFAAAGSSAAGMTVQRIHGDLHLGQTLRTLTGWTIIDFEGEPAKPLAHRRGQHSPLKDIAGMLRSFDYAARMPLVGSNPDAQHVYRAAEWADRNRRAFCDGYAEAAGTDPRNAGSLLRAFELDKAVYEVVYEHGHRPSWVPVPMHAVTMLTTGGKS